MTRVLFSLLIHEEPDVVLDQLNNILYFNPNSYVVIHINHKFTIGKSKISLEQMVQIIKKKYKRVYINPIRLNVSHCNIIQAHISNFYSFPSDFDYFYFVASNELFLKYGAENFVSNYDYGCESKINDKWYYINNMKEDIGLIKIQSMIKSNQYYYSQIEGSFYSKKIMTHIVDIICRCYNCENDQNVVYPREEVYFSTIARNIYKTCRTFDSCLCKIRWQGKILFTSLSSIKKVLKSSCLFSVKRVDRKLNDYLRSYIRDKKVKYVVSDELKPYVVEQSYIKICIKNMYFKTIYFFRNILAKTYRCVFKKR